MKNKLPRPLHDRIIVRRTEEVAAPIGGIIIPDAAKEKPQQGVVLAVGNGLRDTNGIPQKMDVRVDDVILFGKYSGTEVKINGEDLLIMCEEEVFCIL
jgi:chaperonin GroES